LLYFGLTGIGIGYFYTANPLQFGYKGIGEFLCGLGFGPLIVVGTYFVQTQTMPLVVWLVSLPIGFLIANVLLANEFSDYDADQAVHKKTWVVKFGPENAANIYGLMAIGAYISTVWAMLACQLPHTMLLSLFTFPLALKALQNLRQQPQKLPAIIAASAKTIQLHLLFGILLSVGLFLDKWI